MTAHTITDPPHRLGHALASKNGDFVAWIKTADGFYVKLEIGGAATQEQADKFVRETAAAAALLEALKDIVKEIRAYQSPECDDEGAPGAAELKAADAAIAKAIGAAS